MRLLALTVGGFMLVYLLAIIAGIALIPSDYLASKVEVQRALFWFWR